MPGVLGGGQGKILAAIVQHGGCDRAQLTVLTGYRKSSRDTYIQKLTAAGLIERGPDDTLKATKAGERAAAGAARLPEGTALLEHWLSEMAGGEREILVAIAKHAPRFVTRDALSAETQYKKSSRDTYIQRLAARNLIKIGPGVVRLSPMLQD